MVKIKTKTFLFNSRFFLLGLERMVKYMIPKLASSIRPRVILGFSVKQQWMNGPVQYNSGVGIQM